MPLTFFIPVGLFLVVAGLVLHRFTTYRVIAKLIIAMGLAVAILVLAVTFLAVGSM